MKTRVEVHRQSKVSKWEGDLPLVYEGLMLTLPDVVATRVTSVVVRLMEDGPEQIVYCAP